MKKRSIAILLALLLALGLSACGGKSAPAGGNYAQSAPAAAPMAPGMTMDAEMPVEAEGAYWDNAAEKSEGSTGGTGLPMGVKMIYRAGLELETQEFEQADAGIKALTKQLGGYFEEQSTRTRSGGYRSASYTVRVPAERFEEFLSQIGTICTVTFQNQSAEDVSEAYYDTESRLETARIKLDRLQDLLRKAELMEDIITLESAISETEYQIERLSGDLRHYDALIGYSTVSVSLNEVYRITEPDPAPLTFGQRLANSFREGLSDFGSAMEDLAEWLAYSWLKLLVFALIVFGIVKLIARLRAKRGGSGKVNKSGKKLFGRKDKTAPAETAERAEDPEAKE